MLPGTSGEGSGRDCAWHDMEGMGWWFDVEEEHGRCIGFLAGLVL
jgi:hypothetical protein